MNLRLICHEGALLEFYTKHMEYIVCGIEKLLVIFLVIRHHLRRRTTHLETLLNKNTLGKNLTLTFRLAADGYTDTTFDFAIKLVKPLQMRICNLFPSHCPPAKICESDFSSS